MPLRMSYFSGDYLFPLENRHLSIYPSDFLDFVIYLNSSMETHLMSSFHLFVYVSLFKGSPFLLGLLSPQIGNMWSVND